MLAEQTEKAESQSLRRTAETLVNPTFLSEVDYSHILQTQQLKISETRLRAAQSSTQNNQPADNTVLELVDLISVFLS
jgi:hypothetical protein